MKTKFMDGTPRARPKVCVWFWENILYNEQYMSNRDKVLDFIDFLGNNNSDKKEKIENARGKIRTG